MAENREAKILEKTYKDRLTVYRKKMGVNPDTLESRETEKAVYEEIKCALSQKNSSVPEQQEFYSKKQRSMVIFTSPGVFIQDNDRAVIQTEAGQLFQGKTGKTFAYSSHGETPFMPEGVT